MSIYVTSLVWKFSKASGSTLLTALAIADFADDEGRSFPSVATLAKKARISERSAQYALAELRDAGELSIEIGAGPHGCNLYRIQLHRLREDSEPATLDGGANFAGVQPGSPGGATHCTQTVSEPSTTTKKRARKASPADPIQFNPATASFDGISSDQKGRWSAAYPATNVEVEILKAAAWVAANPGNRKTLYTRFLTNWLARAQDRAGTAASYGASHGHPPRLSAADQRNDFITRLTGRPVGTRDAPRTFDSPT